MGVAAPGKIWRDTKFDKEGFQENKLLKKNTAKTFPAGAGNSYSVNTPLVDYFENSGAAEFPEFTGFDPGHYSNAGATDDWSDAGISPVGPSSEDGGSSCSSSYSGSGGD